MQISALTNIPFVKKIKLHYQAPELLPFIALVLSSIPILTLKYPYGHDWIYELVRVAEYKNALLNGQYPPYLGENLYQGYGSPIFLFYAPLYLIVSTAGALLTESITEGSVIAILFFSLISLLTIKHMMQSVLIEQGHIYKAACRISSYFFILNPYIITDKLIRNANAEYVALCLAPLSISGFLLIKNKPLKGVLILSIGFALAIISHNLTALIVAGVLLFLILLSYFLTRDTSTFLHYAGSIFLGLGLASFFWLPAISYKSLVRIDQMMTGKFDYHNQFQPVKFFFGYDNFFSIGFLPPAIIILFLLLLATNKNVKSEHKKAGLFAIGLSLFFLLLQTQYSLFIWEKIPLMPLFQFPWRMMGPLSISTAVIAGLSFLILAKKWSFRNIIIAEIIIFLLCALNAYPTLESSKTLPLQTLSKINGLLGKESIKRNKLKATVGNEYLPRHASAYYSSPKEPSTFPVVYKKNDVVNIHVVKHSGTSILLQTENIRETKIHIKRWFFPGWECFINQQQKEIEMNQSGTFDITIPKGKNLITLRLNPPALRVAGNIISLISLVIWSGLLLFSNQQLLKE